MNQPFLQTKRLLNNYEMDRLDYLNGLNKYEIEEESNVIIKYVGRKEIVIYGIVTELRYSFSKKKNIKTIHPLDVEGFMIMRDDFVIRHQFGKTVTSNVQLNNEDIQSKSKPIKYNRGLFLCGYCGQEFIKDSRGGCSACGGRATEKIRI